LIILITLGGKYKSLHLSLVQIFSPEPCSQTPSVCVPP
jgi:hypothetical protein